MEMCYVTIQTVDYKIPALHHADLFALFHSCRICDTNNDVAAIYSQYITSHALMRTCKSRDQHLSLYTLNGIQSTRNA